MYATVNVKNTRIELSKCDKEGTENNIRNNRSADFFGHLSIRDCSLTLCQKV